MQPAGVRQEASPPPPAQAEPSGGAPAHRDRIASLYDEHGPRIYHYLLALLGNRAEAEDVLQAVFVELVRRPGCLEGVQSPRTYLLTVARHCAGRARKHAERRRQMENEAGKVRLLEAGPQSQADPEETLRLEQAILGLPAEQREVLLLKAFEELTFREIGDVLGVSENTAASRYRYALDKLRARLGRPSDP
jgi:RNA polymerase sigma-70 factor, ECF subfamily